MQKRKTVSVESSKQFPKKTPKKFPKKSPKKSLGQNFLTSTAIAGQITDAAELSKDEVVLEIGPGKGMLTRELLARAGRVIAIEKDDALFAELSKNFREETAKKKLQLVHGDALEVSLSDIGLVEGAYKLVANIPYNITGLLLRHFLSHDIQPKSAVLLVQKEVAQRICANDKKESILSISVKAYGMPRIVRTVKAGSFYPKPKVDSAVLHIADISRNNFLSREQEAILFTLVKTGFAQKRKQLAANLQPLLREKTLEAFAACKLDPKTRAENLSVREWVCLAAHKD